MNKIAEVVFAYSPKNDDELELTVGDKIEVIGFEEEGWWKGKLNGKIGVFPSNFVVVETVASSTPSSIQQQHGATSNKLNSIFGSKFNSKSNNSLNTNNSTSNNSLNNNYPLANNSYNSANITNNMNNANDNHTSKNETVNAGQNESYDESNQNSFRERARKPIGGVGFGDIFAAGAKTKPSQQMNPDSIRSNPGIVGSIVASERSSSSLVGSTLQKPIPKKPPPPAPSGGSDGGVSTQNGSTSLLSEQAPALPPKPSNQSFSPFMQSRLLPQPPAPQQQQQQQQSVQRSVREQARVIHRYDPTNDDELELKVNDIINIIDKKSEDYGWWRGELNGKIGVFPDNFVQIITVADQHAASHPSTAAASAISSSSNSALNQSEWPASRVGTSSNATNSVFSPLQQQQMNSTAEGRVKSVFSSTPKGFSKELESNLEKHSTNPASFLSLKRNKSNASNDSTTNASNNQMNMGFVASTRSDFSNNNNSTNTATNGHSTMNPSESSSPTKLNHITANRAKGPTRRPPSNILSRRNQQGSIDSYGVSIKKEVSSPSSNDSSRASEQPSIIGRPQTIDSTSKATITAEVSLVAPTITPNNNNQQDTTALNTPKQSEHLQYSHSAQGGPVAPRVPFGATNSIVTNGTHTMSPNIRPSSISSAQDNGQSGTSPPNMVAPKIGQRASQQPTASDNNAISKSDQKTPNSTAGSPPTTTPSWMVNLRKTNAEKKRDPITSASNPTTPTIQATTTSTAVSSAGTQVATHTPAIISSVGANQTSIINSQSKGQESADCGESNNLDSHHQLHRTEKRSDPQSDAIKACTDAISITQLNQCLTKYDELSKQISENIAGELNVLRKEFKQIQEELKGINELKNAIEIIKVELKACQSATDNQRKYIKELVNNLADERKKIAALQVELDRNLK